LSFIPLKATADTVFLKNGKQLTVEKAWQEDDQVWLIFSDMKASIPQSKVSHIERDSSNPVISGASENQNNTENNGSVPQPADKIFPNQVKQTVQSAAEPQQPIQSTNKLLVLRKDGFGDMTWGSKLANVRGLEIQQSDSGLEDVIEYVRPQDALKLGDANLKAVVYAFWRDQLYTVTIWTEGQKNFIALRDAVFDKLGKATRVDDSGERYLGTNDSTDFMLKYTDDGQYGLLWMRCKKLDRKLKLSKLKQHTSYLKRMRSKN
jgi:hypothetical protein